MKRGITRFRWSAAAFVAILLLIGTGISAASVMLTTKSQLPSRTAADVNTLKTALNEFSALKPSSNIAAWESQVKSAETALSKDFSAARPATSSSSVAMRHVTGRATTLGAGNFTGGKEVAPGLYDVTTVAGQSGNFIVNGTDSYDEILGGSIGVSKIRVHISDGDSIQISGLSEVIFTPVSTPYVTKYEQVTLYAGTWTVGQDLAPGRYVAKPGAGQSGNFIIDAEGVDEILGGSIGVPSVTFNVNKGDVIEISGMSEVILTPA